MTPRQLEIWNSRTLYSGSMLPDLVHLVPSEVLVRMAESSEAWILQHEDVLICWGVARVDYLHPVYYAWSWDNGKQRRFPRDTLVIFRHALKELQIRFPQLIAHTTNPKLLLRAGGQMVGDIWVNQQEHADVL